MVTFGNLVLVSTIHYSTFSMPFRFLHGYPVLPVFILRHVYPLLSVLIIRQAYPVLPALYLSPCLSCPTCYYHVPILGCGHTFRHPSSPSFTCRHLTACSFCPNCCHLYHFALEFPADVHYILPACRHHIDKHSSDSSFRHTTTCSSIQS
jgi:hypothetical protein